MLELGQLYERRSGLDFGIDGVIELVSEGSDKQASGRQVGVQVKRGLSIIRRTRYGRTLYCTEQHANYWLGHSLPIIVVQCEPVTNRLRWQHVNANTLRRTSKGFAIDLPEDSDLCAALVALQALAGAGNSPICPSGEFLLVPYSFEVGVQIDNEELGLAALALSRSALRGDTFSISVEIEGEAELIASIDAIRDVAAPNSEQRRDAIIRLDILDRYRKHARTLERALILLLTQPSIAEQFGYQDQLVAAAFRRTAAPLSSHRLPGEIGLQAWPGYHLERLVVGFDVPSSALEEFYERGSMNRQLIKMGSAGGVIISDLGHEVVTTRFLPVLVHRLLDFADANDMQDHDVLACIEAYPTNWLVGLA